ncbi:MAG: T9SS type A sorting domain-containing protein [Calditrichaeota bacterium]|nr:T9SS type A sorting domain-containing protein [Calditrichota bacterium]
MTLKPLSNIRLISILAALFLGAYFEAAARTPSVYEIQPSIDPTGAPLPTRAEYLQQYPECPLNVFYIERFSARQGFPPRDENGALILAVNSGLLNRLQAEFDLFTRDLIEAGYDIVRLEVEGGAPAEFKRLLIEQGGDSLVGLILCGELPLAWFEQYHYFRSENEPDNLRLHEYPIDLFFMDLDGEWQDTSGNEIYDVHSGAWQPDVFLGRIAGYNLSRIAEDTLVANYLRRVHSYRVGELKLPHRAFAFIDDDWRIVSAQWATDVGQAWGRVDCTAEPESTSAVNYRFYLSAGGELMQVGVHSTADSHAFLVEQRSRYDYFRFRDLREDIAPNIFFYNLFACSVMNLSRNLCLGALYALKGPFGLGAVGPAKTGGMLFYNDYYRHIAAGEPFGEALRRWFVQHGREPGHENWSRSWFNGMTYFGDPTLKLRFGLKLVDFIIDDRQGDGDARLDAGETVDITLTIANRGVSEFANAAAVITGDDEYLTILNDSVLIGNLNPGEQIAAEGLRIRIDAGCLNLHSIPLSVRMDNADGDIWWDNIKLVVFSPVLAPVDWRAGEIDGDGDGLVEAGEVGGLSIGLQNIGGDDVRHPGRLHLATLEGHFQPEHNNLAFQPIAAGETGWTAAVRYRLDSLNNDITSVLIHLTAFDADTRLGEGMILLPCAPDFQFEQSLDEPVVWGRSYSIDEGFRNVWRWAEDAGDSSGGLAFGGPDTIPYPPLADGAFELPLMRLAEDAVLEIRHKIDIEAEYDAAVIEFDRGAGWRRAAPSEGYNGISVDNGSFPGGECWNGQLDWQVDRIPLGVSAGALRIRLRFASDSGVEGLGWYIDRLSVRGSLASTPLQSLLPLSPSLLQLYPNPFNNRLTISLDLSSSKQAALALYDITGKKVADLSNPQTKYDGFATGVQTLSFDGSHLPAGVYILCLETQFDIAHRKIVLLK